MAENDFGRLIYLVVLGTAIAGYFFAQNRQRMGQTLQQIAIWGFIFLGVIAGYGLWNDIRATVNPRQMVFGEAGRVEVPRAADGHFYLTLTVENMPVEFMVDTGASAIVLTREDAARIGIDVATLRFTGRAQTANGAVASAPVRLGEMRLGTISDRNIRAEVNGGELGISLLGMDYLNRFERLEIARDRMTLIR